MFRYKSNYDPSEFIVPAHDASGRSKRARFHIHPGHVETLDAIIWSRHFPYRNRSDAYRHGIDRLFVYLSNFDRLDEINAQYQEYLDSGSDRWAEYQSQLYDLENQVEDLLALDRLCEARALLNRATVEFLQKPQTVLRTRCLEQIQEMRRSVPDHRSLQSHRLQ
jgi:hypothetical protein